MARTVSRSPASTARMKRSARSRTSLMSPMLGSRRCLVCRPLTAGHIPSMESAASVGGRVRQSTDHGWLEQIGRLGLLARGLMHGIVAWLATEIAHGDGRRRADSQGALAVIAHQPLGRALLVAVAAGLLAYAVW